MLFLQKKGKQNSNVYGLLLITTLLKLKHKFYISTTKIFVTVS